MTAQERDEFRAFKHAMGDTLKDCCFILGSSVCLRIAYGTVRSSLSRPTTVWQEIEAPLSTRSMGAEVDPNDDEVAPLIMDLIPELPAHPRVRYAATLVIRGILNGSTGTHSIFSIGYPTSRLDLKNPTQKYLQRLDKQ